MNNRRLFFDPISGTFRFDTPYSMTSQGASVVDLISWPDDNQRQNKEYGIKNLTLALTLRCNFRCDYCWQVRDESACFENDMSEATIRKWLDFFIDNEKNIPAKVLYYGGEPLLRPDLIRFSSRMMDQLCQDRNIMKPIQHIFTNGSLLTDEMLDMIQEEDIFLILSLDGDRDTTAVHRKDVLGICPWDDIMNGVRRLRERAMKYGVCCTVSRLDFNVQKTAAFLLDEIKPVSIEISMRHDKDFRREYEENRDLSFERFYTAWDLVLDGGVRLVDVAKRVKALAHHQPLQNSSSGSKNKLSVMTNGKISTFNGAVSFSELQIEPIGNWVDVFKTRWKRNVRTLQECKDCEAAYICGQGSAFTSYLQYGTFDHLPVLHCHYCKSLLAYISRRICNNLGDPAISKYGGEVTAEQLKSLFLL